MSRFVSQEIVKIDLGEGDFVNVRKELSYSQLEPMLGTAKRAQNNDEESIKMAIPLLKAAIVSWEMKGPDGQPVEFSPEKITEFTIQTLTELVEKIVGMYFPEKKSS